MICDFSIHPVSRQCVSSVQFKQNIKMKFALYCLIICTEIYYISAVDNTFHDGEACLVQYLQRKGKLDASFKLTEKPSPNCVFAIPLTKMVARKSIMDKIEKDIPSHSECLMAKFDSQETLDLLIKISVVHDGDDKTELQSARNALRDDLKTVMSHCETNDARFSTIFDSYLGIKNETLEVLQQDYCLAKYVADNKIVDLKNIDLNPHQIDTGSSLNCNQIVDRLRNDAEKELADKISTLPKGQRILGCVMNAFQNGKVFDSGVALKVLYNLDVPTELKESEKVKLSQKLSEFGLATFTCS